MFDTSGPSGRSRRGLDWFTFFIANLQTGFGPFVSVYLTAERWTQVDIGLVLTIGGIAGLLCQVPGGALVDASRGKRGVAAASLVVIGLSALALGSSSLFPLILVAWIMHAAASCTLSPAISAISLGLVGHAGIARRLGRNASFGSIGSAIAAAVMGGIGYYISNQAVFIVTAALMIPALLALGQIRADEVDPVMATGGVAEGRPKTRRDWLALLTNRPLCTLLACMVLFHLANAAMLPLVGSVLTLRSRESPAMLIAACIIVPQVMVALLSPLVGSLAQRWGRRPLLLIGFAALPLKGLCFGLVQDPHLFVVAQCLDGVSAAIIGVLVPLVAADATRVTGRFALAQGLIGTGMGVGASISTLLAGFLADRLGSSTAFLGLAGVGAVGFVIIAATMPETRPRSEAAMRRVGAD